MLLLADFFSISLSLACSSSSSSRFSAFSLIFPLLCFPCDLLANRRLKIYQFGRNFLLQVMSSTKLQITSCDEKTKKRKCNKCSCSWKISLSEKAKQRQSKLALFSYSFYSSSSSSSYCTYTSKKNFEREKKKCKSLYYHALSPQVFPELSPDFQMEI